MFYYPNVLQRHTGCFSTVWLAATRGIRVSRREFLKVNVFRTCGDILDYVTAQVPSLRPNEPRPRFSLYLSSQLQYGVVVVYHKQCVILLEEIQHTIDRLMRAKTFVPIDVNQLESVPEEFPDNLPELEGAEGAQDPFFGLMESHQLPTPYKIPQLQTIPMDFEPSPCSSAPSSRTKGSSKVSPSVPIELTEREVFGIIADECFVGDDLQEATARDIELLMDQADPFWRGDEKGTEGSGLDSFFLQLKESEMGRDSTSLLTEEMGLPMETAGPLEITPPRELMVTPHKTVEGTPSEEVATPSKRPVQRRRRQLIFADPETQITESEMQMQIQDVQIETQNMSDVLVDIQAENSTTAELFGTSCRYLIHEDLQALWKRQASIRAVPSSVKRRKVGEEEESEPDMEILRKEMKNLRTGTSGGSGQRSADNLSVSDVQLEMSKDDKSGSDIITPVSSRWSPQEEGQPSMAPIAEENIEMPEAPIHTGNMDLLSCINSILQRLGKVTFHSLLPPQANRSIAAFTFCKLLELLTADQVTVCQTKPYNRIHILPPAAD